MIDITILRAMAAAGATVDMILAAIEAAQAKETEKLAARRASDAERQWRKRHGKSRGVTRSHTLSDGQPVTVCDPPVHIDTPLREKPKKVSLSAIDVPEDASEVNRTFAKSKGWDDRKTASEWQRFRDHSLSKGKKHRNVDAAWRNWVTSPFQAQTGNTPDERSVLKAADRQLDQFGGRAAAANYVPGSSGPRPLSLDYSDEPPSPKLISSR